MDGVQEQYRYQITRSYFPMVAHSNFALMLVLLNGESQKEITAFRIFPLTGGRCRLANRAWSYAAATATATATTQSAASTTARRCMSRSPTAMADPTVRKACSTLTARAGTGKCAKTMTTRFRRAGITRSSWRKAARPSLAACGRRAAQFNQSRRWTTDRCVCSWRAAAKRRVNKR